MNATLTHLHRLLAYFENGAASIRSTLALMAHDPTKGQPHTNGHPNGHVLPVVMRKALALDGLRRAKLGRPKGSKTKRPTTSGHGPRIMAQRARSAALLATFDPVTPRPAPPGTRSLGSLVRRGYVKQKGDGYVRTAKPYAITLPSKARAIPRAAPPRTPKPAKRAPGQHTAARLQQRAETARNLALFNTDTPVTSRQVGQKVAQTVQTLERWGYIKRKGEGFLRTAKPFVVDDRPQRQMRRTAESELGPRGS